MKVDTYMMSDMYNMYLISATLIIFTSMGFPVTQTHPAKVIFTL